MEIVIVGAGIGGLTLALQLHRAGIASTVYEAATALAPLGLGINLLPHSTRILSDIGVLDDMQRLAITTTEAVFFNRFGQLVYREPAGRLAGFRYPQLSIHRGDIQLPLAQALRRRAGEQCLVLGHRCVGFEQDATGVLAHFEHPGTGERLPARRADLLIAADGLHSLVRRQLHPDEGDPRYSGVNMWRGATVREPILTGASMIRAGWLTSGKMVIYPIRDNVDGQGRQLVNWVAELETPKHKGKRDWNKPGDLDDFLPRFADWKFDWLDVPELIRSTEHVLEFPMVDQDPLPFWTAGRVTLMGDAAHPMYPRGSNGAAQAIVDAEYLARCLAEHADGQAALKAFEAERLPATTRVVLMNRSNPPDAILREVFERTGDRPFERIDDVISADEMAAITERYRQAAGITGALKG